MRTKVLDRTASGEYNNTEYDEYYLKNPFAIVFHFANTVWPLVLPVCLFNCLVLSLLDLAQRYLGISLSIMPQGHALMSILLVSLGVSKVNLAYARYANAQLLMGHALMTLRELHQLALTVTEVYVGAEADDWRLDTKSTIIQLIHELVATLRDGRHAAMLAMNVGHVPPHAIAGDKGLLMSDGGLDDPMTLVVLLRNHLYNDSCNLSRPPRAHDGVTAVETIERCKMIDLLHEFTISYRNLLRLASAPMPFVLIQMVRTFTFVWILTIPFVLSGRNYFDIPSAFTFVILLTYGFLGLELVSRMLSNPFGDEITNVLNIKGMGTATVVGIERDSQYWRQKSQSTDKSCIRRLVQVRDNSFRLSGRYTSLDRHATDINDSTYSEMGHVPLETRQCCAWQFI
jgi:predicted membrane chloride channel (bestrophin family)